jgi:hypothetical protein
MTAMTYLGRLHQGRIELDMPIDLPEGSEVYVVVKPQLDLRQAQKKANGWLVDNVGNMVMADEGMLLQSGDAWLWRFSAYVTALSHEPFGPIGQVDVDANTGAIVIDERTRQKMIQRGAKLTRAA